MGFPMKVLVEAHLVQYLCGRDNQLEYIIACACSPCTVMHHESSDRISLATPLQAGWRATRISIALNGFSDQTWATSCPKPPRLNEVRDVWSVSKDASFERLLIT